MKIGWTTGWMGSLICVEQGNGPRRRHEMVSVGKLVTFLSTQLEDRLETVQGDGCGKEGMIDVVGEASH
jgi:hypothetical protein